MPAERAPVAVIIPVYNRRLKLIKTLASVAGQSRLPAIVIVVDDGSTDGTAEAARAWLAINARFEWRVVVQKNAGVSAARNAGFAHIGDLAYVCFLDSDDVWGHDFIAEAFLVLDGREDIVAAIADRVEEAAGEEQPVQCLRAVSSNAMLWLICNFGGILSCTLIRSNAAEAAGLFVPGMVISEDTDFLFRLFSLGGAAHSKATPVLCIKNAPVEPTEPQNLSYPPSPELRYLWACYLATTVSKLPKSFFKEHEHLIRAAVAQRWASIAFLKKRKRMLAFNCLLHAIWWDHDWGRRLHLIWSFLRGRRKLVLHCFDSSLSDYSPFGHPASESS